MFDYIPAEQFLDGVLWALLIIGGLFFVFLLVAMIMLLGVEPKCPDHVRRAQP